MRVTTSRNSKVYKLNGYPWATTSVPGPVTVARPLRPMALEEFRSAPAGDVEVETLPVDEFRARQDLAQCEYCGAWDAASRLASTSRRYGHSCYRFPKDPPPRYEPATGVDAGSQGLP